LVVAGTEVNLGEDLGAVELIKEVVGTGKRVTVLDGDFVEGSVVHTHPESPILLGHEEDRSAIGRFAWADVALGK
jgi:hypothetical protein